MVLSQSQHPPGLGRGQGPTCLWRLLRPLNPPSQGASRNTQEPMEGTWVWHISRKAEKQPWGNRASPSIVNLVSSLGQPGCIIHASPHHKMA